MVEEPNSNIKWNNTNNKKRAVQPAYRTGVLAECPNQLEGNNALAAMVLEGLSDYLQKNWKEPVMACSYWPTHHLPKLQVLGKYWVADMSYLFK